VAILLFVGIVFLLAASWSSQVSRYKEIKHELQKYYDKLLFLTDRNSLKLRAEGTISLSALVLLSDDKWSIKQLKESQVDS
jgi:hypothetical protein